MRQSQYQDSAGRYYAVLLPDGLPDSDASLGILLGPPSLKDLNLPETTEIALHNQLFSRRIFTVDDIKRRRQDVTGAIQGALKLDVDRILAVYLIPHSPHNEPVMESSSITSKKRGGNNRG